MERIQFKKKDKLVDVLFDNYVNLSKVVDENINLDILFLMQVTQLRTSSNIEMSKERINQVKAKKEESSKTHGKPHLTVLPINDIMLLLENNNSLSYDGII